MVKDELCMKVVEMGRVSCRVLTCYAPLDVRCLD